MHCIYNVIIGYIGKWSTRVGVVGTEGHLWGCTSFEKHNDMVGTCIYWAIALVQCMM